VRRTPAAVIDVGGSGAAVWSLAGGAPRLSDQHPGAPGTAELALLGVAAARHGDAILVATPGQMDGDGLLHAANLGWSRLSLAGALDLPGRDVRWVNDAAAIAAGERALHGLDGRVLALVFGTGLGVAVADAGGARTLMDGDGIEAGHMATGDPEACPCGRSGCVEVLARRWMARGEGADALGDAVRMICDMARPDAVVLCGGALRDRARMRALLDVVAGGVGGLPLFGSAAPRDEKSAAPHGTAAVWAQGRRPG